jgi:2-keto-3-deoxy-L-rhamnonate aldolase RhmA
MAGAVTPPFWPKANSFLESLQGRSAPQAFMWVTIPSTEIVEMAGALGLDCAVIDLEHTATSLDQVQQLVAAAQGAGMTALVRVPTPDSDVGRLLDLGVQGIVFPRIASVDHAATAKAAMCFPPTGTRGWSGAHVRTVRWTGTTSDGRTDPGLMSPAYLAAADASLVRIFMIEDEGGVEQIDAILDQGEPHGVIFGWGDYTISVGFDTDRVAAARTVVTEACQRRGIGLAISAVPPDGTTFYPGCFYSAGVDSTILSSALVTRIDAVRRATTGA